MEKEEKKKTVKFKTVPFVIIITILVCAIGFGTYYIINERSKENCRSTQNYIFQTPSSPGDIRSIAAKPVIYIYPEQETKVSINLGKPENLTCTYPKYENGWKVIASPNGNLTDIKSGKNLYCLYWEGINTLEPNMKEGFVVKGEDTTKFLEEKLKILGLNEREANEFIIYWLPQMEGNTYNFIRFQTEEEINKNMPLEVSPNPDTIIRIVMEWKALDTKIEVKEQELEKTQRNGFTVIEWGGTIIK